MFLVRIFSSGAVANIFLDRAQAYKNFNSSATLFFCTGILEGLSLHANLVTLSLLNEGQVGLFEKYGTVEKEVYFYLSGGCKVREAH
jgi:hypothetical protein